MFNFEKKDTVGKILYIFSIALLILMIYYCFTRVFMWRDEYFTLGVINLPLQSSISKIASDVHPPLYYFIVKSILYFFNILHIRFNLINVVKLISVLPYLFFLILSYTKIRKEYNWLTAGLFSFTVVAMSEFFMFYQIMRMYSWAVFFTLMAFLYVKEILESNSAKSWVMLTLFTVLGAYTHYFSALTLITIYVFLLAYFILYGDESKKEKLKYWVLSVIASIMLYIPWVLVLFDQIKLVHKSFWIPYMDLDYFIYCISYISNGSSEFSIRIFAILALIILLALVFKEAYKKGNKIDKAYLVCGISTIFVLIICCILFSYVYRPILVVRYLLPAISIFWLVLSIEIGKMDSKKLMSLALIIILILSAISFTVSYEDTGDLHTKHQKEMKKISVINNTNSSLVFTSRFFYLQFKDTINQPKHYIVCDKSDFPDNRYYDEVYIDNETFRKMVNENTSNTYFGLSEKDDIPQNDKETERLVSIYSREFYKFV